MNKLIPGSLILMACAAGAIADTAYQSGTWEQNYIPFAADSTPGRPSPGNLMGNQVTLAGTDRFLDSIQVGIGEGFNAPPDALTDTFTVTIYANDGADGGPGTILGSSSLFETISPTNYQLTFDFDLTVPDTFTVVVGESDPSVFLGLVSTNSAPVVGSALNGLWFNTNSEATSWVFDTNWALADGASSNIFQMDVIASPEPASLVTAGLGLCILGAALRYRRCSRPAALEGSNVGQPTLSI